MYPMMHPGMGLGMMGMGMGRGSDQHNATMINLSAGHGIGSGLKAFGQGFKAFFLGTSKTHVAMIEAMEQGRFMNPYMGMGMGMGIGMGMGMGMGMMPYMPMGYGAGMWF